jgi:uncharacterized cysteine cluster protein YcgN (CxxCxxCC family)
MIIYISVLIILLYFYVQINSNKKLSEKYRNNQYPLKNYNDMEYLKNVNNFKYNKEILNNYDYFTNECDLCPMGCYKQCSNNYSYKNYPPEIRCNAYNLTQDLCNEKYSQKFLVTNYICNYRDKKKNIIPYPKTNPRVNLWNSE